MPTSRPPRTGNGPLPDLVLRAIAFAARRHGHQIRKDGRTPYISHPFRVLFILNHLFGVRDPETLAAGVLHDTIEDTTTDRDDIEEHFGARVAYYVATLSKDKRWPYEERQDAYHRALAAAPIEVKLVKLADVLDNTIDSEALDPAHRRRSLLKARRLVAAIAKSMPSEWKRAIDLVRPHLTAARRGPRNPR